MQTQASLPQLCLFDPETTREKIRTLDKQSTTLALAAAYMRVLALEDPDNRVFFTRLEGAIQRHAQRTREGDARAILSAIKQGHHTAKAIAERTAIALITVQKQLRQLRRENLIVAVKAADVTPIDPGRGGDRRTIFYFVNINPDAEENL